MKKLLLIVLFSVPSFAQLGNVRLIHFPGAPAGACTGNQQGINDATGDFYVCKIGAWFAIGPGAAGSAAFDTISSGTNNSATMTCTTGCTVTASGSGVVNATTLLTKTWAAPAAIGTGTPAAITGTTITATQFVGGGASVTNVDAATLQTHAAAYFQQALTLTTTGSSGAATLVGGTLNIPQYSGGGGSGCVPSGTINQILTDDGAGGCTSNTLTWDGTALSIPGATAILPSTAAGGDIGSATLPFQYLWFAGSSGTPGTNNFKLIGASTSGTRTISAPDANTLLPIIAQRLTISGPTAARTITTPDANFTVARTDAANTFTGVQTMTSPVLVTPNLGIPSAIDLTNSTSNKMPGAAIKNAEVTATQLAAQYSKDSCTEVWGGSGTSFAMTSGDDAIVNNSCYNDSGVTRTITAVKCRSDNAGNTTTVNPTFGAAGTGTSILSGALTCGNSYAYSSSGTVSNSSWTTGTGVSPGMATAGNATSIAMIVEYTF